MPDRYRRNAAKEIPTAEYTSVGMGCCPGNCSAMPKSRKLERHHTRTACGCWVVRKLNKMALASLPAWVSSTFWSRAVDPILLIVIRNAEEEFEAAVDGLGLYGRLSPCGRLGKVTQPIDLGSAPRISPPKARCRPTLIVCYGKRSQSRTESNVKRFCAFRASTRNCGLQMPHQQLEARRAARLPSRRAARQS